MIGPTLVRVTRGLLQSDAARLDRLATWLGAQARRRRSGRNAAILSRELERVLAEAQAARRAAVDSEQAVQALGSELAALRERLLALEQIPRPVPAALADPGRRLGRRGLLADQTLWIPFFAVGIAAVALLAILALGTPRPSRDQAGSVATPTPQPTAGVAAPAPISRAVEGVSAARTGTTEARPSEALAVVPTATLDLALVIPTAPARTARARATATVAPTTTAGPSSSVAAGGSGARLRAEPSTQATVIAVLADGTQLVELSAPFPAEGRSWIRVEAPDGKAGWLDRDLLQPAGAPGEPPTPTRAANGR